MRHFRIGMALLLALGLSACDDGPERVPTAPSVPPMPTPPPMMPAAPLEPAGLMNRGKMVDISKATMKRYRVEICYFGSLGVPYAREAYWASLGPEEPSALHLPNFGTYKEHEPLKPGGRLPIAATTGRLPFENYLRACASAKTLAKKKWKGLNDALETFDDYTSEIVRMLSDASRYYAREEFKRDDFKKGLELHVKLSDELSKFEALHAELGVAYREWYKSLKPIREADKLDAGGKISAQAVIEAREVALLFVGKDAPEASAVDERLAALKKSADALKREKKKDKDGAFARLVVKELDEFFEAVDEARQGPFDERSRYLVGAAFSGLVHSDQRALTLHLSGGDPFGAFGNPKLPEITPLRRKSGKTKSKSKGKAAGSAAP